ncbi:TPA: superantigen-like protein, partial [Staphylococcus aureus]|nr:superantigen-like protein [Staphylococcus aureus]
MSKNITKNIILTTTLLLLGTVLPQNQKPVFSFYSEAKAYSIGQDET